MPSHNGPWCGNSGRRIVCFGHPRNRAQGHPAAKGMTPPGLKGIVLLAALSLGLGLTLVVTLSQHGGRHKHLSLHVTGTITTYASWTTLRGRFRSCPPFECKDKTNNKVGLGLTTTVLGPVAVKPTLISHGSISANDFLKTLPLIPT